jgi:hypothetical protein
VIASCPFLAAIRGTGGGAVLMFMKEISLKPPPQANQLKKTYAWFQGCGSGAVKDPYSFELQDPEPYLENGSGSVFRKRIRIRPLLLKLPSNFANRMKKHHQT